MAEASVASTSCRYYCHVCNEDISPVLPEYTCPRCQGGFIEQRSGEEAAASGAVDDPEDELLPVDESGINALAQMLNFGPFQAVLTPSNAAGHDSNRVRTHRYNTRSSQRNAGNPGDQLGIFGEILNTLFTTFPNVRVNVDTGGEGPIQFRLHGNPGDYAWGNAELDRIITQLLNQLDASGPPPLSTDHIKRLPTVHISQANVDVNLQCMVCFEDYVLNEPVRELPCAHLYHNDCIVPWLELHGTCPVCRSSVDPTKGPQPPATGAGPSNN